MNDNGQCSFCLNRLDSINTIICSEDKKLYQDIYECSQKYLQDEIVCHRSFDWNNSRGLLPPFCAQCFQSAHKIQRTIQELEKLQAILNGLVKIFRDEVILRISKFSQIQSDEAEFNPDEFEDVFSLQPAEVEQKEVVVNGECVSVTDQFDDNRIVHETSPCGTDDERSLEIDDAQEEKYILSPDEPPTEKWPRVVLDRLQIDNNGRLNLPKFAKVNKCSVEKITEAIRARTTLKDSRDLSAKDVPPDEGIPVHRNRNRHATSLLSVEVGKRLKSRREFLAHKTKDDSRELKCQTSLNSHKTLRHGQKQMQRIPCSICGKLYQKNVLAQHEASHELGKRDSWRKCSICNKKLKNEQSLNLHMAKHEKKKKIFSCELCEKSFPNKWKLKQHCRQAHDFEKCKCEVCGKIYKNEIALKWHVKKVHRSKTKTCEYCGLSFKTNYHLKSHIDVVHKKILKHQCAICGKCFLNAPYLKRHEETHKKDSDRRTFKCEICGDKFFKQKEFLTAHQKQIHNVFTNGPITCHHCHSKFQDSSALSLHNRRQGGNTKYKCEICQETFTTRCNLYIHSAKVHPTEDKRC